MSCGGGKWREEWMVKQDGIHGGKSGGGGGGGGGGGWRW